MAIEPWVEKYRPKTVNDYVWKDEFTKQKIMEYLNEGTLPHLLFAGKPGTGKTSITNVILNELKIPKGDILWIYASRESNIESIRSRIGNFVNTWALGPSGIKYVVLDELDSVSIAAQKMLRTDMERYISSVRFIATCNYIDRIEPALRSRFTEFVFKAISLNEFTVKAAEILLNEGIPCDLETLQTFISASYPDMRKCINLLSQNTVNGVLSTDGLNNNEENYDDLITIIDVFKNGTLKKGRELIASKIQPEQYPEVYRYLYSNLELFGDTQEEQEQALLKIRKGVVDHSRTPAIEINLAAVLVELTRG